jgi:hypothetical protein
LLLSACHVLYLCHALYLRCTAVYFEILLCDGRREKRQINVSHGTIGAAVMTAITVRMRDCIAVGVVK